ncbi:heme biosynthesis protein HemY [Pseudovibrio sp. SPO723]|uniref:heme biosynthesis protein HemY n=1 Tax=Nesiotobacter zosterae TaxID=392721 RepID=UPI0029C52A9F|nr:heme biosynthesis HemY N-terminal domain-containing protein [Pseudovibrio sp. SPO723]MDX5594805.1 heme biosynthesis HemY N-terminal domain-containing protein [Pseudovibrio sp. SPO723]
MIRVLFFFAVVFLLALGGAWIADRPGIVTLDWEGYRIQASLLTTLVALGVLLAVTVVVWGLMRLIWKFPSLTGRFMQRRRKDRGFDALSKGLLALGAGDAMAARKHGLQADKLLKGDEPAAKLLLAQAAQMFGDHADSRKRFEAMLEDPRAKAVGLHGLFIEAERQQEPVAARHFAQEASALVPGLKWAGKAVLGYQAVSGDWEAAISSLNRNYTGKLIDKKTYRRHKAVLLTARALELESQDPDRARTLAVEAHGLAPDLVPAALVASRLQSRRGDIRKASKTIEATWKLAPHPDLADAYAHVRPGDSILDRLNRVKHLANLRAHSGEGALAVAIAAMDARDFDEARAQLKKVLRSEPTQRAFLLMADLEEMEYGDQGRVREWMGRAVRAPQDKVWIADGMISAHWAPVSPKTGRLDAYEWKQPETNEEDRPTLEPLEDALFEPPVLAAPTAAAGGAAAATAAEPMTAEAEAVEEAAPVSREADEAELVSEPEPAKAEAAKPEPVKPAEPETAAKAAQATAKPEVSSKPAVKADAPIPDEPATAEADLVIIPDAHQPPVEGEEAKQKAPQMKDGKLVEFPLSHLPDDPGPDGEEDLEAPKPKGVKVYDA